MRYRNGLLTFVVAIVTALAISIAVPTSARALIAASAGSPDAGTAQFAAFRDLAEPIADLLGPMPYTVIQSLIDPLWPKGIQAYFKGTNLSRLDDALIDTLTDRHQDAPGPQCEIHVHQMGGAVGRVGRDETAFVERSMPYVLNAVTGWQDSAAGQSHRDWARNVVAGASDQSTGLAYSNFLGDPGAGRASYDAETYDRLAALKDRYDPTNLFRLNQNVVPAGSPG